MVTWLLDRWHSCVRALRSTYDDPALESPSFQNCWSWSLKRWLISGGSLEISISPRARVLRCCWLPKRERGPKWHFEPIKPKKGIKAIWHAFLHKGKPKLMR